MSYARMPQAEARLTAEIEAWFEQAAAADAAEDRAFGADARGDEMPDWVANKQKRLAKIKEAKAALEAEATAAAAHAAEEQARPRPGRKPKAPSDVPADKAQRNFTDPDSRILKTNDGFIQGYNAQAAVDAGHQVIVAHGLTNSTSDQGQLVPMVEAIEAAAGAPPDELSADAGYCSEDNLETLTAHGIRGYIATGRQKHGTAAAMGRRTAQPRQPEGGHGHALETRRAAQSLPFAQDHRRAGLWPDQASPRLPPVPAAWSRQRQTRMGPRVHRPQPDQAGRRHSLRPGRLSAQNRPREPKPCPDRPTP